MKKNPDVRNICVRMAAKKHEEGQARAAELGISFSALVTMALELERAQAAGTADANRRA